MYLSKDSLGVEIVSSKSSEMNVLLPSGDDYVSKLIELIELNKNNWILKVEQAVPEQFKTVINGTSLLTSCNESLG